MNNEEPIILSHYPGGRKPPSGDVSRIERDDFPAPPYPYTDPGELSGVLGWERLPITFHLHLYPTLLIILRSYAIENCIPEDLECKVDGLDLNVISMCALSVKYVRTVYN